MDLVRYQLECQNTKSNEFFGNRVTRSYFINAVQDAIESLARLDAIKKALFYGKESKVFPVNGAQFNDSSAKLQTCNSLQIHLLHNEMQAGLDIFHGIVGKATEAAELLELLLKVTVEEEPVDHVNLIEEIGDGMWYDAIILRPLNTNFYRAAELNNLKLKTRFPDKFTTEAAITRNLEAEREQLEEKTTDADKLKAYEKMHAEPIKEESDVVPKFEPRGFA